MTPGLRTHKQASARVVIPDLQDIPENLREITSLQSRDAGKGHATALMWELCREADVDGMVLLLEPKPFADALLDQEKLERFYGKFGFIKVQQVPVVLMARNVWGTMQ